MPASFLQSFDKSLHRKGHVTVTETPAVRGQWWSAEEGSGTLDDLVAGLARVAFKPPVGLFTEGIPCKVNRWFG